MGLLRRRRKATPDPTGSFQTVVARGEELLVSYRAGQLSQRQLAAELAANVVVVDGVEWTIGATSGDWYARRPGGQWRREDPPVDVPGLRIEPARNRKATNVDPFGADGTPIPPPLDPTPPGGLDEVDLPVPVFDETADTARLLSDPAPQLWPALPPIEPAEDVWSLDGFDEPPTQDRPPA